MKRQIFKLDELSANAKKVAIYEHSIYLHSSNYTSYAHGYTLEEVAEDLRNENYNFDINGKDVF